VVSNLPVYASAAALYVSAGWPAVIPVPHHGKTPPPEGFTGEAGRDTTPDDIARWASNGRADSSVALRMPNGVIGIDVDQYLKGTRQKVGAQTLEACQQRWGLLPPTWSSTARGADQPSRISFYRVPVGRYRTVIQPDIEIIQRHHRYAVVWPSVHEDTGTTYEWYEPSGALATRLPSPQDLAELRPEIHGAWLAGLREGATDAGPVSAPHAAGEALLSRLGQDTRPACSELTDAAHRTLTEVAAADHGTRHDAMAARVHRYVMSAAHGHAGFGHAVTALREIWDRLTPGEQREQEFERMLITSARKAVTLTAGMVLPDPCQAPGGPLWSGVGPSVGMVDSRPRPSDNRDVTDEGAPPLRLELPPRPVDPAWGQVIGTGPFEPGVNLDQLLADRMLFRSWPMTRRASDTRGAWLLRGAEQWTLETDLSRRIVAECAALMPQGDPEPPPKGERNPAHEAFKLRNAMHTNARAGAVAGMIRALTDGGRHPAAVKLADLDTDPDILWAGGLPWNLRESRREPVGAPHVHPDTPHLAAAGVMPALVPTPAWDRFLMAVWPDEAVRRWCLRVLSIAVTGYPDAALPVLFGPGGSGKTSLVTLLMECLGSYAHAANPKLLSDRADQFMTWQMRGRRLSFIDEAMREGHRNAETLKQLTGGGSLTGAAKYQNEVTFPATHTLVLTSNTAPHVHDPAIRRRVRLLPCDGDPAEVRAARQALTVTWAYEAPGVLARLMLEAAAWLSDPDSALMAAAPLSVQSAMDELVTDQDVVAQWLAEAVVPHDHGTQSRSLYVAFRGWCRDGGIRDGQIPTEKAWGVTLTEAGFPSVHRRDGKYRPLLIRSDGGGWTPPTPTPDRDRSGPGPVTPPVSPGQTPFSPPQTDFRRDPSSDDRSQSHQRRSTPVFDSSVPGVTPPPRNVVKKSEKEPKTQMWGQSSTGVTPGTELGETPLVGGGGSPCDLAKDPSVTGQSVPGPDGSQMILNAAPPGSLPIPLDPSRKVTASEVAQVATARDISKAQARELIKTETRRLAVEQAEGPTVALPAAVDRAGTITPLTYDDARARVAAARARSTALTVDVETSGYPLGHRLYQLRLVQLGDAHEVVVFDAAADASVIRELLAGDFPLHAHSATADLAPLSHAGLIDPEQAWTRMHDTVIPAKLADPSSTGADPALKKLSPAMLGEASTTMRADAGRREVWKAAGWLVDTDADTPIERNGWAQIRHDSTTMIRYAGSDVLDTAAIALKLADQLPAPTIYARERLTEAMTARVSHRGLALDVDHIRALEVKHTAAQAQAAEWIRAQGIDNPGSGPQVAAKLAELGAELPRTKPSTKHPDGQPSTAEGALDPIAQETGPAAELAQRLLAYREHTTALGLFLRPYKALCEHGDGRARPTVYTLGTNTGRMCLPREHSLVTMYGYVKANDVAPGLLTLDANGRWVRVLDVHYYADAPLQTLSNRGIELAGTPEHRWVTSLEHDAEYARRTGKPTPLRKLRALDERPRLRVHLAPAVEAFDFEARTIQATTDAERFAALVGMLVTDGRCTDSDVPEEGMRAYVYQTEAKFYDEFIRVIPGEAVMYDRITQSGDRHHEIRLSARWLRPRLKQADLRMKGAGLRVEGLLKESSDLYRWVATLPLDELRAFFSACWLSDGSLEHHDLFCRSDNLRAVLTLAAYRLGVVAYEIEAPPSDWSNGPRRGLSFREPVITTRKSVRGESRGDVWCVTTETGTFTAVNPRGTVYLTGNSAVRPNIQQLPRSGGFRAMVNADPGQLMISADFSGVELRVAAALSGDPELTRIIADDRDLHMEVARLVWGPDATKAHRYKAKGIDFGYLYGGGVPTLAAQAGVSHEIAQRAVDVLKTMMPTLAAWSDWMQSKVKAGETQFPTYSGRIIHLPVTRPHAAGNYGIQGTARELLVDALVKWNQTKWGNSTLVPVHDELLCFVPEAEAEEATRVLVQCMETELNGVRIVAEADPPSFVWQDSA
jgi:P4 family phage/plasmid primase-like protien